MTHFARFTAALALAGAILSSPAYAAIGGEPRSVVVRIADLNMNDPLGRATLMRRIDHAAVVVCGRTDSRDLVATQLADTCRAEAVDAAMPQVQLALAGARNGRFAANAIAVSAKAL